MKNGERVEDGRRFLEQFTSELEAAFASQQTTSFTCKEMATWFGLEIFKLKLGEASKTFADSMKYLPPFHATLSPKPFINKNMECSYDSSDFCCCDYLPIISYQEPKTNKAE
jgi:hypothetical protein